MRFRTSSNGDLSKHVKGVHEKVKNHSCVECEYKTFQRADLVKHVITIHQKIQAFSCSECDYKAYLKSSTTRTETPKHVLEKKSSKVDTKEIIKIHKELKDSKVIGTKATNPTFGS